MWAKKTKWLKRRKFPWVSWKWKGFVEKIAYARENIAQYIVIEQKTETISRKNAKQTRITNFGERICEKGGKLE